MQINTFKGKTTITLEGFAEMQVILNALNTYQREYGRTQFIGEDYANNPEFNEHHYNLVCEMVDKYHDEYIKD